MMDEFVGSVQNEKTAVWCQKPVKKNQLLALRCAFLSASVFTQDVKSKEDIV